MRDFFLGDMSPASPRDPAMAGLALNLCLHIAFAPVRAFPIKCGRNGTAAVPAFSSEQGTLSYGGPLGNRRGSPRVARRGVQITKTHSGCQMLFGCLVYFLNDLRKAKRGNRALAYFEMGTAFGNAAGNARGPTRIVRDRIPERILTINMIILDTKRPLITSCYPLPAPRRRQQKHSDDHSDLRDP